MPARRLFPSRGVHRPLIALLVLGVMLRAVAAESPVYNPVYELRQALQTPIAVTTPQGLSARGQMLQLRVAALCHPAELRDALLLEEWRDGDFDEALGGVDRWVRAAVARRFEQVVGDVPQRGAPPGQAAAANMLGEMASMIRATRLGDGVLRRFGPLLAELCRGKDPVVCEAAARALSRISPQPAVAAPALDNLLQAEEVALRRTA